MGCKNRINGSRNLDCMMKTQRSTLNILNPGIPFWPTSTLTLSLKTCLQSGSRQANGAECPHPVHPGGDVFYTVTAISTLKQTLALDETAETLHS
jgi:hypothetical protein